MITNLTSSTKALYTDTNGTLSYNPYSDTLTANFFQQIIVLVQAVSVITIILD